jgi:hypothetical protein
MSSCKLTLRDENGSMSVAQRLRPADYSFPKISMVKLDLLLFFKQHMRHIDAKHASVGSGPESRSTIP